jgi:hypothetical protein
MAAALDAVIGDYEINISVNVTGDPIPSILTPGPTTKGTTPPKFAHGGFPPINRPSWVGEQGPELFMPNTAGQVIPHGESMAMVGGGGSTRPIIIYGDIHVHDVRDRRSLIDQITKSAMAEV